MLLNRRPTKLPTTETNEIFWRSFGNATCPSWHLMLHADEFRTFDRVGRFELGVSTGYIANLSLTYAATQRLPLGEQWSKSRRTLVVFGFLFAVALIRAVRPHQIFRVSENNHTVCYFSLSPRRMLGNLYPVDRFVSLSRVVGARIVVHRLVDRLPGLHAEAFAGSSVCRFLEFCGFTAYERRIVLGREVVRMRAER